MGIEKTDKNFAVETSLQKEGIKFRNIEDEPFRIYGVKKENGKFRRMPDSAAKMISDGVRECNERTAGGRVRFVTDSSCVAIHAVMDKIGKMPHISLTGSAGLDMYFKNNDGEFYGGTFIPPYDISGGYDSIINFLPEGKKLITAELPLYSDMLELYIGLDENAVLERAEDYTYEKPIVYYGSSITQGGCASKPGSSYQSIISRMYDVNYINLGFSGSCRGEEQMAEYIAGLEMSVFVYDYDHNAPNAVMLGETHEKFFKRFRLLQPDTPVIMMSMPKYYLTSGEKNRRGHVKQTYDNAVASGDKNVYYIDGSTLMDNEVRDNATVDNCHPTDSGFVCMARRISKELDRFFEKR